ncbi:MAG TPA: hypothetical protein VFM93_08140 [Candidatus Limnocylindria bacterium]|nr:hypothetical protein [Candidatus Limnocylindria bacterium]
MRALHRFQSLADLVERRAWTVRLPHAIHVVRLERSGFGDRLLLDDREVARTHAFAYDGTLRFSVGAARAEMRSAGDSARGVLVADLYVEGQRLDPDPPAPRARTREPDWRGVAERGAYAAGALLVIAGLAGDALTELAGRAVRTAGVLLLTVGLRAIDPVALFPAVIEKIAAGQVPMIVAGLEVAAVAAIARDRLGIRRRIPLLRSRSLASRALGWAAVAAVALVLLALA